MNAHSPDHSPLPQENDEQRIVWSGGFQVAAFANTAIEIEKPKPLGKPLDPEHLADLEAARRRVGHKTGPIAVREAQER